MRWLPESRERIRTAFPRFRELTLSFMGPHCTHLKGRGGVKGTLRWLSRVLDRFTFVARLDVVSYYSSLSHRLLIEGLRENNDMPADLRELVRQYVTVPDIHGRGRGIVAGSPLSPLLGALYLAPLDRAMGRMAEGGRIFYLRFMDDIVILARSRWDLRRALRTANKTAASLSLRFHRQEKRFIGRISKGFDFLGYRIHPRKKLRPSGESLRRLTVRAGRLYEQGADPHRLRQYVHRWCQWLWSGDGVRVTRKGGFNRYWIHVIRQLGLRDIEVRRE